MPQAQTFDKRILFMTYINMFDDSNARNLPLDALRTFVAAAQLGSFTRAGQEVHRTQSAVSMQIKRLETELERPLFVRTSRAVTLTAEGERLLGHARKLLRLHDKALADMAAPVVSGMVSFGVPDDYATAYLPSALRRFAAAFPKVRVDVTCDASPHLLDMLRHGKLDLCLTTGNENESLPPSLKRTTLARLPLLWMGAARYELEAVWPPDSPLPLALFHEGCAYRRRVLTALDQAQIPYRVVVSSLSMAAVKAAVSAGLAVSAALRGNMDSGCRAVPASSGPAPLPALPAVPMLLTTRGEEGRSAVACLARYLEERVRRDVPA